MLSVKPNGISRIVGIPRHGRQDTGIAAGGGMDQFSLTTGNILLNQAFGSEALEIILPTEIQFERSAYFVVTGAHYQRIELISDGQSTRIEHGCVYFAAKGNTLILADRSKGFRAYLCYRCADDVSESDRNSIAGRCRGTFSELTTWPDKTGRIRVVPGPEFEYLSNPDDFTTHSWSISHDSNDMGMRLINADVHLSVSMDEMISSPVADGTIQCTSKGPIILLRNRQTIGGYPRIFNVISADIDLIAQYAPGQKIRFSVVTIAYARAIALRKKRDIAKLRDHIE